MKTLVATPDPEDRRPPPRLTIDLSPFVRLMNAERLVLPVTTTSTDSIVRWE